eukprot:3219666-Prymnesium_polylepis.1
MLREPPSMGSRQRVRARRDLCETEESEAAGAVDSTKGWKEAQRGMWWWRNGLGWGFLRLPCLAWSLGYTSSVSSITCDKNSSKERRRLYGVRESFSQTAGHTG